MTSWYPPEHTFNSLLDYTDASLSSDDEKTSLIESELASVWLERLQDESEEIRAEAAETLGQLGLAAEAIVPALAGCLADESAWVRVAAVRSLIPLIDMSQPDVIQSLFALLQDDDDQVRFWTGLAFIKLGNESEQIVQTLLDLLANQKPLPFEVIYILVALGNQSEVVRQALLTELRSNNPLRRERAEQALAELGASG